MVPYIIDDTGYRLEDGYCGEWAYKLVYQSDSETEYDKNFVTFNLKSGFYHIEIFTMEHKYSNTVHNLQLITELKDQNIYPKSIINFKLDLSFCTVSYLEKPKMGNY